MGCCHNFKQSGEREFKWAISLLILTVLLYVVVYHSASLVPNFPASVAPVVAAKQEINNIDIVLIEAEDRKNLEGILKEASMKDKKTVIVTLMNQAWAEPNSTFDAGNGTDKLLPHIVIACNLFFNGNFSDRQHNEANGGFIFATANHRTIELYKYWYKSRLRFPGKHDQDVLNYIRSDQYINKIGLGMRFIDTVDVGSFCQPNWEINKVSVVHGNCCIGQSNKVKDLRQFLEDWTIFFANGNRERMFRQPMNCRRSVAWRPQRKHKRRG
ncbi:hypothetical protein Bca52824_018181 [Brassica carinata]|uniref:Nucleotide-diphospho-sugar transferase domain-containing protein n=1 Tax=Brassica carinata TaxID=52824 RepID=A0A8X7VNZ5_BRACI|nr:hypothetical protein Bca52824_018181 [Brassica carinata]